MKRNDEIMFSRDGRKFQKATFICNCELNASKIRLGSEEWTVKQSEVYSIAEYKKVQADKFYDHNEKAIDAWAEAETKMSLEEGLKISKASIARTLEIKPSKFSRIIKQWLEFHKPALATK